MSKPVSPFPSSTPRNSLALDMLYGAINCVLVIPVSISFCTIIFRHSAFLPYLPYLVKLVMFSSAIHQLVFSLASSLPFAVGQVQDAGLIFLCAMAIDCADQLEASPSAILPTTLLTLSTATALLGLLLIAVSRLRLASMVQYLPMPVVGGYLAFIGFFCGLAGLSLMAGVQVTNIAHLPLLLHPRPLLLLLPGLLIGVGTYLALLTIRSPFVLPATLALILLGFYTVREPPSL